MVAIVGLVGSGRSELGRLLYGLQPTTSGSISLREGPRVAKPTPRWASRAGVGYVPQERTSGLAASQTIAENLAITSFGGLVGWFGVSSQKMLEMGRRVVSRFGVKPNDPTVTISTLSGGNQQKIALGKWTRLDCALLIMDEPLQGIDVGAKIDILKTIRERVLARGGAVLWLESDIEYVPAYADRVLVMRDGRIATEISSKPVSREDVLMALYGAA
jgi:ribose transport system ATP-binding protein